MVPIIASIATLDKRTRAVSMNSHIDDDDLDTEALSTFAQLEERHFTQTMKSLEREVTRASKQQYYLLDEN